MVQVTPAIADPIPGLLHITGNFYDAATVLGITANAAGLAIGAAGVDRLQPFRALARNGYDRIAINVTVAGAGGTLGRMAVYTMGADGLPAALVVDSGTFPLDGAADQTITVAIPTTFGQWYWTAINVNGTPTLLAYNTLTALPLLGYTASTDVTRIGGVQATRAFAAFPASLAGVSWTRSAAAWAVRLRAA